MVVPPPARHLHRQCHLSHTPLHLHQNIHRLVVWLKICCSKFYWFPACFFPFRFIDSGRNIFSHSGCWGKSNPFNPLHFYTILWKFIHCIFITSTLKPTERIFDKIKVKSIFLKPGLLVFSRFCWMLFHQHFHNFHKVQIPYNSTECRATTPPLDE